MLKFFAEKMWVAFALQKLLTFFQQKISEYCILNPLKQLTKLPLTSSLSWRRVEHLGPGLKISTGPFLLPFNVSENCWISGKQCRSWSNAAECLIWVYTVCLCGFVWILREVWFILIQEKCPYTIYEQWRLLLSRWSIKIDHQSLLSLMTDDRKKIHSWQIRKLYF